MQQPENTLGVWEITSVTQRNEVVTVTYGFVRDWQTIVRTTCHALGIEELPTYQQDEKHVFDLVFHSKEEAEAFLHFTNRE